MEWIVNLGMECVGEFVGEPAVSSLIDEGLNGGDERALTRKPDRLVGPQAGLVEARRCAESVVAAAMGVAGQVVEELELAEDREIGRGSEGLLEFGEGSDFVAQQVLAEDLGIEGEGSHNVIVPAARRLHSELYHNKGRSNPCGQMRQEAMIIGLRAITEQQDRAGGRVLRCDLDTTTNE